MLIRFATLFTILFTFSSQLFALTKSYTRAYDETYQYAVYLPEHWTRVVDFETGQHFLFDTSKTNRGIISIYRESISKTDFPQTGDWTTSNFLAYRVYVENNELPDGQVIYFNDGQTSKQQSLWAPEIWARFYGVDTSGTQAREVTWSEFTRFTESGGFGYELYAYSDTADMNAYLGLYMAILNSVIIPVSSGGSSDAYLWALDPSAGSMNPPFSPLIQNYTLQIGREDSVLLFVPEPGAPTSTVHVQNQIVAPGAVSQPIRVAVGQTDTVKVRVTAQDNTLQEYSVAVTRTNATPVVSFSPHFTRLPRALSADLRIVDPLGRLHPRNMFAPGAMRSGLYFRTGKKELRKLQ